jgi:chromosome segregation ATPase
MSADLDKELDAVVERRKKVAEALTRLKGRREQAESALQAVEEECRAKKIDPDQIDDVIEKLEDKYSKLVEDLKRDTEEAEKALAPFVGEGTQ